MIRIHTLGGLSVRGGDGKQLAGAAAQPRRMAILALLARGGERGMSREKVLSLLWPDADAERGPRALAQALYALRKDLGADDAIAGAKELRLDPALASSDVGEFAAAVARGDDTRAAALYEGPFLDGFHLAGAEDFARWVEGERATLVHDYVRVLESLARTAFAQRRAQDAVSWWRKVAALDPLNARFTVGLMEALVAASDRAGAIKQAHVYRLLIEQELDLPPDREVMALAERLRNTVDTSPSLDAPRQPPSRETEEPPAAVSSSPPVSPAPPSLEGVEEGAIRRSKAVPVDEPTARRRPSRRPFVTAAAVLAVGAVTYQVGRTLTSSAEFTLASDDSAASVPVIAVGRIASYGEDSAARTLSGPVSELLSTSLARVQGLRVISQGRMLELMRAPATADTSAGGFVNAARRAGAGELIDGTLYTRAGGRLRLDLRRVALASGAIGAVQTVEGSDLFALVDSGTTRIVATLGRRVPAGSVADVTTRSAVAYGLYIEGMRTLAQGDLAAAERLFGAALREDSTFALAAYYYGRLTNRRDQMVSRLTRAIELSARATERERLMIRAGWAWLAAAPELSVVAESLVTRYPLETEGYLYSGIARIQEGGFLAGIPPLRRVIAMDSLSFAEPGRAWGCSACTALSWIISAYELADSLPAAEREARRYTRLQPGLAGPWILLWDVLERAGRFAESERVAEHIASLDRNAAAAIERTAYHAIRKGDFSDADRLLHASLQSGNAASRRDAMWTLVLSLRYQGRVVEAIEIARRLRTAGEPGANAIRGALPPDARPLGVALLEAGRYREAAALLDSIAKWRAPDEAESGAARDRAWGLTQAARALAAGGDTTDLAARADTIAAYGARSGSGRDQRLHHYVRGLLWLARGDSSGAETAFRSAIWSSTAGYTSVNVDLAKVLMRRGRPSEAVTVLQPALRGKLDASNYYATHTELHELLGLAWDAAGQSDSAAVHLAFAARAWSVGDPTFRPRGVAARERAARLLARGNGR